MDKLIPILILAIVVIISGCVQQPPNSQTTPQPKLCEIHNFEGAGDMIVEPGYYFDSASNECKYYEGSNYGNNQPPFATMEDCTSTCGEPDPATLCDNVQCPADQVCFEGGCISTN